MTTETAEPSTRLLDEHELAQAGPPEAIRLPLDLVHPNAKNPRKTLPEVTELADDIHEYGLMQPVVVRRVNDVYELIGGHRRHAAFCLLRETYPHDAQWRTIPAVIKRADDDKAYLMLLSSQLHTRQWRPREEAAALETLAMAGLTNRQIGERLHKSESGISKRLRVYADSILSGPVQARQLSPSVAEILLSVTDLQERKALAETAIAQTWTLDKAQAEIRKRRTGLHLAQIARRARELVELLSSVAPGDIPIDAARDLWALYGRIEVLSGVTEVHLPTVDEAERAAGIKAGARRQKVQPPRRTKFRST